MQIANEERKRYFKAKSNRGITLIALVITIIILLILAGITINLALGDDGIIKRAQDAGDEYAKQQDKEIDGIKELENKLNEIADKVTGNTSNGDIDESILALKVGDFIKYDTGKQEVGNNGIITCRIMYPANSKYGLQIISNANVLQEVTLGDDNDDSVVDAYNGAIIKLNDLAENYINQNYAKDARCPGCLPDFTKKDMNLSGMWDAVTPIIGCYDEDTNYEEDLEMMNKIEGINNEKKEYWLASRFAEWGSNPSFAYPLGIRYISNNGELSDGALLEAGQYPGGPFSFGTVTKGLRVCLLLDAEKIVVREGNGTDEENAYILSNK